jgi:hypothetical protein
MYYKINMHCFRISQWANQLRWTRIAKRTITFSSCKGFAAIGLQPFEHYCWAECINIGQQAFNLSAGLSSRKGRYSDWLWGGRPRCRSSDPGRWKIFLLSTSRLVLGPTQSTIQWVLGALSLGLKRPGREANHSLPTNAEAKNTWMYTHTSSNVFMA